MKRRSTSPRGKLSKSRARADESEQGAGAPEADPLRPRPDTVLAFLKALWVARVKKSLDVRNFGLVAWPPEVKNSPGITEMHIDNNNLRAVPDDVSDMFPYSVCLRPLHDACARAWMYSRVCVHAH
jgi:hypothetical protein